MTERLEAHFFRHAYARLVASFVRRIGPRHLESVEDAVQSALLVAVQTWPRQSLPNDPMAWLYRVAQRQLASELRRAARHGELAAKHLLDDEDTPDVDVGSLSGDFREELLRMLFVCCDDAIPVESQLVLALKTLCGFGVSEIAERLFMTEANVYKRLERARHRLHDMPLADIERTPAQQSARLPSVHAVLYTLFSEGHLSSHAEGAIRRELCDDAVRLATMLAEHPIGATPAGFALVAVMYLHRARLSARQDGSGGLLLLEEQDRARFDPDDIAAGLTWLARAAQGSTISRYHAEAGIAAEHCLARTFAETRFDRIVDYYELLERLAPSALHTLNRAVALAELRGPEEALSILAGLEPPSWLAGSYQWSAVLSDLHRRTGRVDEAHRCREAALSSAPSDVIRETLARRLR